VSLPTTFLTPPATLPPLLPRRAYGTWQQMSGLDRQPPQTASPPQYPRSFLVRIPGAVVVAPSVCAAEIGIGYAVIADIAISALRLR
jgi:hypothetical protein